MITYKLKTILCSGSLTSRMKTKKFTTFAKKEIKNLLNIELTWIVQVK